MGYPVSAPIFALCLFLGMLLFLEFGWRAGLRRAGKDLEDSRTGVGAVEGAIFALLGLLIAFTFAGAASRFDTRRQLVVEEANAIGTAYLRLNLLSGEAQTALQENFRHYLDSRLEVYRKLPDIAAAKEELARATKLQGEIWNQAVTACRAEGYQPAAMLLLPAVNAMIDITTTRTVAAQTHPPFIIFVMLFGLALISSFFVGHGMAEGKTRNWLHIIGFAGVFAISVYVILEIEFPRMGLIRVDAVDQVLVELRESMK